ncbi:tRNase Z TRZ3, mitochondrial [Seminavis robusta]|uniref:ribonuclease Z n=1 Tax=Seminavis robusta TaxID=568900 RepID=A0A9N8DVL3_9STRA|nr:tRNase Z TRZ3, mitochondrial [Seminavis robusta]|eukprot:Sro394_g133750.1 tRNase Z TRZ3, mitochondrial (844) ;mRNA; f:5229-7760
MTAAVRVLTTRTVDSSPALLLIDPDGSKTLVNCGEGCQRSFLEHAQKLSSVTRVCLTHLANDSLGGLPGMVLSSADAAKATQVAIMAQKPGAPRQQPAESAKNSNNKKAKRPTMHSTLDLGGLELVGPEGTKSYFHSLRHFLKREEFKVTIREGLYQVDPAGSQEEVSRTSRAKKKRKRQESKQNAQSTCTNGEQQEEDPPSYFGVQTIPITYHIPTMAAETKPTQVVSYVFQTPPISGKFLPDKAKELGIPPGPLYAKLKRGENVTFTNKDGQECHVEGSQVVLQPTPGMIIAVLYYPTMQVWREMQPKLDNILANKSQTAKIELVVHMTSPKILNDPACQAWRAKLQQQEGGARDSDNLQPLNNHLFLETCDPAIPANCQTKPSVYTSACIGALVRSQICPDLYKTPDYLQQSLEEEESNNHEEQTIPEGVRSAVPMLEYTLLPRSRKGYTELLPVTHLQDRRMEGTQFLDRCGAQKQAQLLLEINKKKQQFEAGNGNGNIHSKAELLMTGTGSAIPCKHRNVTGMCLRMDDGKGILLDVGEGTVGQLLRASLTTTSAAPTAESLLKSIQAAWISHPHADHHLGLLRLLTDRQAVLRSEDTNGNNHPLLVIGPPPILDFLREYEAVDPRIASSYVPLDCRELVHDPKRPRVSMPEKMKANTLMGGDGISRIEAIPVAHCPFSFAVVVEGTSFGTVAYSGDCRPSSRFAQRAQASDLLIHEATFEDGMEAEATMKRHSTVGEAIRIAHEMKAKRLVLTHFSQRYPKIPPIVTGPSAVPIIFAFDYMALTPQTLDLASQVTPAMRSLYPDEVYENGRAVPGDGAAAASAMSIPGFFAQNPYDK